MDEITEITKKAKGHMKNATVKDDSQTRTGDMRAQLFQVIFSGLSYLL